MSLYDVKKSIRSSTFLLDVQKEKIIDMLDADESIPEGEEDILNFIDVVFKRMFDISLKDLNPEERILLSQAIKEYYIGV